MLGAGWRVAGWLANTLVTTGLPGDGKLARTFRLRRGATVRMAEWAARHRDPARPLLWVHAPSVGEGLMARPVLERIRASHPDWQVAYTYFSPSAERFAARLVPSLADMAEVLPFDTVGAARRWLDALAPSALVFAKLDVWPLLVREATRRGTPVGLVSAALDPGSSRRGALAAAALRDAYAALGAVGAVDATTAEALVTLGVRREVVSVTGDTRYDQVLARVGGADAGADAGAWVARLGRGRPTLVAGSTWPTDETVLLAAWREIRRTHPTARLVVAPHEPVSAHLASLAAPLRALGGMVAPVDTPEAAAADVVLVDRVGILADLYAVADVAYVGGGFHDAGLHSVVEPAAWGRPVVCGPRDARQRDAAGLAAVGALRRVADAAQLAAIVRAWFDDGAAATAAGDAGRAAIEAGRGAAAASVRLVERLVERAPGTAAR